ncbi:hypothetical protein CO690_00740 [Rothia mucilaginosa]|jgi:hypothetical protein|uniref:Uncharacterized protein n=1 Tax=Rothia mucilaginosa TaxID=43675 RepID=A0A291DCQ2_9MICC|nr:MULTISPECIES: hypothetical protein [Rothia]ATF62276.1 hypothetical protein CO690_00740 [Rothia mucilaginosa]
MTSHPSDVEPAVPFDHKTDRYEGIINGELLAAKWFNSPGGFIAIIKETSPITGVTEICHVNIPCQNVREGVPHESDALQIRIQEHTPENKILTSRHVARYRANGYGNYIEMTHWLVILVPESRVHELSIIS